MLGGAPVEIVGDSGAADGLVPGRIDEADGHETLGVREGGRTQQQAVDDAELGRHTANAERQHEDGEQGESTLLEQDAPGDAKVGEHDGMR